MVIWVTYLTPLSVIQLNLELRILKIYDPCGVVIISHLESNPLLTNKYADFLLFKEICYIILKNIHYTPEGLQKIVKNKAAMN